MPVPVPVTGDWWVEGNPAIGGAWDKHVLLVRPETGESWELIGCTKSVRGCLAFAHYVDGVLVDGMPVCAADVSMSAILANRDDPPHRLGIAMDDYAGRDGSKLWGFPRCGDVLRLSPAVAGRLAADSTPEQQVILRSLSEHGARIYDRGGSEPHVSLGLYAGTQWAGSTLSALDVRVSDLELVVE